ncbi:hypothetical protein D0Z00_000169 [Geotrichum galactomycetum]|uniref:Uncharacterized protein n=1 Tax=Geotrichum galactomycetum TaxID=27317 RepID=A0ACB6VAJ2_9ASCO|nr:hypothetical protein D0Z00_000169 [Geotrichum candidum]
MPDLTVPFELYEPAPVSPEFFVKLEQAAMSLVKKGRANRAVNPLWTNPAVKLNRWKFNEWDYGKPAIKLPSNARGLFTLGSSESGDAKIVVRGYDKFFNIDELPTTRWEWIEANTSGPYEVTSKENGCIVFIAGLEDGTLVVTSKQSTGPIEGKDNERNHSWVGQKWVERHLASKNIPVADFARLLYRMNVTAVGELCDDDFEEHVLPYAGENAGIYLHGLNVNTETFTTYPFSSIEKFAQTFGFHTTKYIIKDTVQDLRKFLEECAETGSWNNTEVEGFVIRSKVQGTDFFFKYKFEEPYLMYRQWREVTKAFISGMRKAEIKINKHVEITKRYLDFVDPLLTTDVNLREQYTQNHGIIALRERFLKSINLTGAQIVKSELPTGPIEKEKKYVLVPISTVGCGKTTVANALLKLYPSWGHFQNDDLTSGHKPTMLVKLCTDFLKYSNVVFLDRNNHQFRERAQIFTDFPKQGNPNFVDYIFIALNFNPYTRGKGTTADEKTFNLTRERILSRGDNHQTIDAGSDAKKAVGILSGFKTRYQPLDVSRAPDSEFDLVINLDSTRPDSSRYNLDVIIKSLNQHYPEVLEGRALPTKQELDNVFEFALSYQPKRAIMPNPNKKQTAKKRKFSYFGVQVDLTQETMTELIDSYFDTNAIDPPEIWTTMKKTNRVQSAFHVTLVHIKQGGSKSDDKEGQKLFQLYQELASNVVANQPLPPAEPKKKSKPEVDADGFTKTATTKPKTTVLGLDKYSNVVIEYIAWTKDLVVLQVALENTEQIASLNQFPHITIGTRTAQIAAVNAGLALAANGAELTKREWNVEPKVLKRQQVCGF